MLGKTAKTVPCFDRVAAMMRLESFAFQLELPT
jgi:hypothetical protein